MNNIGSPFLIFVVLAIFGFLLVVALGTTTSESRQAAETARYKIGVGMSEYYVNSYTQTNNCLKFHDVLRDEDEVFFDKSFTVKNND